MISGVDMVDVIRTTSLGEAVLIDGKGEECIYIYILRLNLWKRWMILMEDEAFLGSERENCLCVY